MRHIQRSFEAKKERENRTVDVVWFAASDTEKGKDSEQKKREG